MAKLAGPLCDALFKLASMRFELRAARTQVRGHPVEGIRQSTDLVGRVSNGGARIIVNPGVLDDDGANDRTVAPFLVLAKRNDHLLRAIDVELVLLDERPDFPVRHRERDLVPA